MHDSPGKQITRWYRGGAVTPITLIGVGILGIGLALLYVQGDSPLFPLSYRFEEAAEVLVGVCMIILNRRAGIGVRSDGVIVRSALGTKQWIPWSEIEQFEAIQTPGSRPGYMIAVICRGRKPLYTFGCWFDKRRRLSRTEKMHQVLKALEAERLAATPEASTANPNETLLRPLRHYASGGDLGLQDGRHRMAEVVVWLR
jgi:hypothetical protein